MTEGQSGKERCARTCTGTACVITTTSVPAVCTYTRDRRKQCSFPPFAPIQMASDRRTARKRSRSTTERVCEPIPAERVAHDAEIPDRTSYRYDTSSESSVSPLRPLTHPIPPPRRTDRPLAYTFVPRPVPLRAACLYSRLKPVHVLRRIRRTPRFFLQRSATIACHRKPALRPNKIARLFSHGNQRLGSRFHRNRCGTWRKGRVQRIRGTPRGHENSGHFGITIGSRAFRNSTLSRRRREGILRAVYSVLSSGHGSRQPNIVGTPNQMNRPQNR